MSATFKLRGTFVARAIDGEEIEISVCEVRETMAGSREAAVYNSFKTVDGRSVKRIKRGQYKVLDPSGPFVVTSDALEAL